MCADKWLLEWTISITKKYLKPFNCVQIKLFVLAILKSNELFSNNWALTRKKIVSEKTILKQLIYIYIYIYVCVCVCVCVCVYEQDFSLNNLYELKHDIINQPLRW